MTVSYDEPGRHARSQYRSMNRAWLRRIAWILPLAAIYMFVVTFGIGWLLDRDHTQFWLGAGAGAGATFLMTLALDPPNRIANWKQGWEGERQTAKALRSLPQGWHALHDLPAARGNNDHVVVGPTGVFLLETKNLAGVQSASGDRLTVSWPESPDEEAWSTDRHARGTKRRARELSDLLSATGERVWVEAVMVLWGTFDQQRVAGSYVTWTHGKSLVDTLTVLAEQRRRVVDVDQVLGRLNDPALLSRPRSIGPPL